MGRIHLAKGKFKVYCGAHVSEATIWVDDVTCKNCLKSIEKDLKTAKSKVYK